MTLAARMKKLFDMQKVAYRVYPHKRVNSLLQVAKLLTINPEHVLTTQVLADQQGTLLLVYPLATRFDLEQLQKDLNRNLQPLPEIKINRIFNDCDAGCCPPIGQPYGMDVILDKTIKQQEFVYFSSGSYTSLVQMRTRDFFHLNSRAKFLDFAIKSDPVDLLDADSSSSTVDSLDFPKLPGVALKILQLSIDGSHSTKELIDLVSQDPQIQQQVLLYSQLPSVGGKSEPNNSSVQNIVEHVLGFDTVSHIALSVAAGRALVHNQTPLDMTEFWQHAFYAAVYAERITKLVDGSQHLDPAISYLAGLFHNFGLLLFSQMYPPEYSLLKKWMSANPKMSIAVLETKLLGMGQAFNIVRGGHAQLGERLLRNWRLPESICVITREHHSLTYNGPYASYVKIIQVTNQLLKTHGIGDGSEGGVNQQLLEPLGLNIQDVLACFKDIQAGNPALEQMARSLTKP